MTKTNRFDNVSTTNLIKNLHWLRIKDRISFKILLIVQKALIETAPLSIQSLRTKTESSRKDRLKHSPSNGKYGDRPFVVAAPKLWNALPPDIRNEQNTNHFKQKLKTYLFDHGELFNRQVNMI